MKTKQNEVSLRITGHQWAKPWGILWGTDTAPRPDLGSFGLVNALPPFRCVCMQAQVYQGVSTAVHTSAEKAKLPPTC